MNTYKWPNPLNEAAYHGVVGEICRKIAPHTESDLASILTQLLVGVGNIIGREVYFPVEADRHHGNLNVVIVGDSAKARKGTSLGHVMRILSEVAPDWHNACIARNALTTGEGLIWRIRDPIEVYDHDKGEIVVKDPGVQDKRLLTTESEFANVLKAMERPSSTLSGIIRNAWDGATLTRMTKSEPYKATDPHVSMIGHITIQELMRYLADTEAANGFANRIMWIVSSRSQLLPEGGNIEDEDFSAIYKRLSSALSSAKGLGKVSLSPEARDCWRLLYETLGQQRAGLVGSLLARAEPMVRRIALIYTVLDGASETSVAHLKAAMAIWYYAEQSCLHVFGDKLGDATADKILTLVRGEAVGVSRTDIRNHFSNNQSSSEIERALELLQNQSLIWLEHKVTGGRPSEIWRAKDLRVTTKTINACSSDMIPNDQIIDSLRPSDRVPSLDLPLNNGRQL